MKRTPIKRDPDFFPEIFRPLISRAPIYDSSCSIAAEVIFIDCDGGYYLKSAAKGALQKEAQMTRYFHSKGLAAEILAYESGEKDWLMTRRVNGEDACHDIYLNEPFRLVDTIAEILLTLHAADHDSSPNPDRMKEYASFAESNYRGGRYDTSIFPDGHGSAPAYSFNSADEAWHIFNEYSSALKSDILIHGDACLPNIILDDWHLSGFIDLGNGGVGDRHVDIFWALWSLAYNLKTDKYTDRFLDAYGKELITRESLRAVAAAEVFG